jgi:hypothetical protein
MTYTMDIETADGVHQHPFHLGTIHHVAESFVLERLAEPRVRSIALRHNRKLIAIYDWRALTGEA